jgi:hypothetical protein
MPYRDEKEALRARLDELERAVRDIDEHARTLDEMRKGESELRRQRDELRNKLRNLEGRKLPMLDNIHVASPCSESWSDMLGDDTSRHCLKCEKNVYDLSSMTRQEAEALIVAKEGSLCVRFYRRADGTVLTSDCPVGVTRKRRRRIAAFTMLGAGVFSLGAYWLEASRCVRQGDIAMPVSTYYDMGKMASMPESTPHAMPTESPQITPTASSTNTTRPMMGVVAPRPPTTK